MIRRIRIPEKLNRSAGEAAVTSEQQGWGHGSGLQGTEVPDCRCPVRPFDPERNMVVQWSIGDLTPRCAFRKGNKTFSANHYARSAVLIARCRSRSVLRCPFTCALNISNPGYESVQRVTLACWVEPPKYCATSTRRFPTRIFFHHPGRPQLQ